MICGGKINQECVFIFAVLLVVSFLLLSNLGNQYLWDDEAQTALISETILDHGVPLGYDGKNFFSQELGREYGEGYVWKWHTWLSFYILAAFFKLFGISTFTARLPFALFGIGTVLLTYFFALTLWKSRRIAAIATVFLVFSVPYLLLARQCRFYSLAAFFSLLSLYAYLLIIEEKRYASTTFFISTALLFHTHYFYFGALILTCLAHAMVFHKSKVRKLLRLFALLILFNLPWILWFSNIKYGYALTWFNPAKIIYMAGTFAGHIFLYLFPPAVILITLLAAAVMWFRKKQFKLNKNLETWRNTVLLIFFFISVLVLLIFLAPGPFFRYLTPLIPVATILTALILTPLFRTNLLLGVTAAAFIIFQGPILNYIYEITHDYDGPIEGIVKYLNQHGKETDTVAITYGDLPLKFYTKMRVIGGLTGEDLYSAKYSDWVIIRKDVNCPVDFEVKKYLLETVPWSHYQKIEIDYPDILFENREELSLHKFKTVENEDKIIIYHKRPVPGS